MTESAQDTEVVEEEFDETSEDYIPFEYSISSYGADYVVDGLVRRLNDGSIFVPPFQRRYVWDVYRASRFVESLLLGLPVPGVFLSREEPTQKLLVIDGQQRLKTLQFFYGGIFRPSEREFKLRNVHHRFNGRTYSTLDDEDRRKLDDAILHATIIKQETPESDDSSIYHIFERLNTGGMLLHPQEIRACVYHGPFSDFLKSLNSNEAWRNLYGAASSRMRDQELILRFFALLLNGAQYSKPMKEFLNDYMSENRYLDEDAQDEMRETFEKTVKTIRDSLGSKAFKPIRALKAALADAIMVAVARRVSDSEITDTSNMQSAFNALCELEEFSMATDVATTNVESVATRLRVATEAFRGIA